MKKLYKLGFSYLALLATSLLLAPPKSSVSQAAAAAFPPFPTAAAAAPTVSSPPTGPLALGPTFPRTNPCSVSRSSPLSLSLSDVSSLFFLFLPSFLEYKNDTFFKAAGCQKCSIQGDTPGQNGTFVLRSTGGLKQRAVSPCRIVRS